MDSDTRTRGTIVAMEVEIHRGNHKALLSGAFIFAALACVLLFLVWVWPNTFFSRRKEVVLFQPVTESDKVSVPVRMRAANPVSGSPMTETVDSAIEEARDVIREQIIQPPVPPNESERDTVRAQLRAQ